MRILKYIFFYPLSLSYGMITLLRNKLYDWGILKSYHGQLPIISVGNITVGGNGKTPFCMFLAAQLKEMGRSPIILSRGYKGKEAGPAIVAFFDDPLEVGDEPSLMASQGHVVVVAKDRVAGTKFIEQRKLGDIIILDDGFQHRRLRRDLDLVCVDAASEQAVNDLICPQMLPFGRMREFLTPACKRIDAIIYSCGLENPRNQDASRKIQRYLGIAVPAFQSFLRPLGVFAIGSNDRLQPSPVTAFSGLAKPENFYATLNDLKFEVVNKFSFADHYSFTMEDLNRIYSSGSWPIVCTEKDAIKLSPLIRDKFNPIYVLRVSTEVSNQAKLLSLIEEVTG